MNRNLEEEERRDRERYPNCNYSSSIRKSCANNAEGKFVCETIKNLTRHCPGEAPHTVFEANSSANESMFSMGDMFGQMFGRKSKQQPQQKERGRNKTKDPFWDNGIEGISEIFESLERDLSRRTQESDISNARKERRRIPVPETRDPLYSNRATPSPQYDCPHADVFDKQVEEALNRRHGRPEGPVESA